MYKIEDIINKVHNADCLEFMKQMPDKSIDMILCDLPYGTTACKWDVVIDLPSLWAHYRRIVKKNGAIVLTASQPFTSILLNSNFKGFKVEWIWEKNSGGNFGTCKFQPMKEHESVLVFSNGGGKVIYNPIMQVRSESGKNRVKTKIKGNTKGTDGSVYEGGLKPTEFMAKEMRVPRSIQRFNRERGLHPTQKPVALFEYLIKTYTNDGDTVLDNCAGSGTTGVACKNLNRNFILIEKEAEYCQIARDRLKQDTLF